MNTEERRSKTRLSIGVHLRSSADRLEVELGGQLDKARIARTVYRPEAVAPAAAAARRGQIGNLAGDGVKGDGAVEVGKLRVVGSVEHLHAQLQVALFRCEGHILEHRERSEERRVGK